MSDPTTRLGALLRNKREALGMTLQEVADTCGSHKGHVHALESGRHEPGILLCARLSVALGLPVQAMAAAAISDAIEKGGAR